MSDRERRSRSPGVLAAVVFCTGLALGSLVVHQGGEPVVSLISLSPPVIYTPASQLEDFSIKIPSTWQRGTKLGVKVRAAVSSTSDAAASAFFLHSLVDT